MSICGIQGQSLELTVVDGKKLKNTEWISRQDPYVCLEYANNKYRTRTCTDGGKNPKFQEKFVFNLIEGLREISVVVWNKNTISYDDFIGNGKVQLQKVLSQGYDDSAWALQDKKGRYAGEIRLIMHYPNFNKPVTSYSQSAPPYGGAQAPQIPPYSAPPSLASYPPTSYPAPPHYPSHHPNPAVYPTPHAAYPPVYPPPPSYPSHSAYPQDPYQYYPAGVYPPPPY